jgi:FKBP-type peptidyl-prolyl cis-trans isomerase FkpA
MKLKKKLSQILLIGLVLSTLGSCAQIFFKSTPTGLKYKVVHKGPGPKPQDGEIVIFNMLYKTEKGQMLFNSADQEMPLALQYYDSVYQKDGGLKEVISMLQKGDSTIFKLSAKTLLGDGFEQVAAKHHLEDNTTLLLHMNVQDVMSKEAFKDWEEKQINVMQEKWKLQAAEQLQKDLEIIDKYLAENKIEAQHTASGLRYVIEQPGHQGAKYPKPGDMVKVHYTGKTLDGKVFDTSLDSVAQAHGVHNPMRTYEPLAFQVGEGQVIPGWDEGIMLLTKGTKARLFIPSPLAYGSYTLGEVIKPHTILVFEVELIDVN